MEDGGSPFDEGRYRYVKLVQPEDDGRPESVPPPTAKADSGARRRRGFVLDRVIGILLGIVLGVGIVTAFVFLGSEDTIDAPRINDQVTRSQQGTQTQQGASGEKGANGTSPGGTQEP